MANRGSSSRGNTGARSSPSVPNRRTASPGGPADRPWQVVAPGAERASSLHRTQREAVERAREIVANSGGGEVTIKGRNGQIRDSDTVAPGNDPSPPKDTK